MGESFEPFKILIVDDNTAIHEDFRKVLIPKNHPQAIEELGNLLFEKKTQSPKKPIQFSLDSAHQGQEAFSLFQNAIKNHTPYALAFIDIRMPPGWDGVKTIQQLWEVDPDLQIVICTASSQYTWDEIIRKLGQTHNLLLLKKPFDAAEARQLAYALVEKWSLARQVKELREKEQPKPKQKG